MANSSRIGRYRARRGLAACALLLAGCGPRGEAPGSTDAAAAGGGTAEAQNMRLVGFNDLQGRSAYQPVVHAYGDRRILFVGHHAGEALNPLTGVTEVNGMSILDVTEPSAPVMLAHVPPSGNDASGTQHVQICDGAVLPNADPAKVYAMRTNGLLGYEVFDVTDPARPQFLTTVAETGYSSRGASSRGDRETHKSVWDCETGIGYFNGTPEGWRVTRLLQIFDLSNPDEPRHIRDFGLDGWQPNATGELPDFSVSGLHQAFVSGNRVYMGYGSGENGVLQILDRDRLLNGDPSAADPFAPTSANLLYPQISRLDFPEYWGVHTAKPIYDFPVPDYGEDRDYASRDLLIVASEAGRDAMRCQGTRDVVFILDITQEDRPFAISTFQVDEEPGDFCNRGGRFGPHSMNDAYNPDFDKRLMLVAYFNAGIRAVDIRNPFEPVQVAYFIPAVNENTEEACVEIGGVRECDVVVQTNNVNIDDRGYVYAVDRAGTGLHIVELEGEARAIVGL